MKVKANIYKVKENGFHECVYKKTNSLWLIKIFVTYWNKQGEKMYYQLSKI